MWLSIPEGFSYKHMCMNYNWHSKRAHNCTDSYGKVCRCKLTWDNHALPNVGYSFRPDTLLRNLAALWACTVKPRFKTTPKLRQIHY